MIGSSEGGYTSINLDNGLELQIASSEITYEDIIKSIDKIENIKYQYRGY
jgi:superfamily I DNA and/or RNA helicase